MDVRQAIFLFGVTFLVSVVATYVVRAIAFRLNYVNIPQADRWSQRSVALMGGLAIVASFLVVTSVLAIRTLPDISISRAVHSHLVRLVISSLMMCFVGLVDDRIHLKPSTKLVGQIAAAAVLMGLDARLHWTGFEAVDTLLTFFWVIGITNAFNLLDNMDGLSTGTACIASLFCALLFAIHGQPTVSGVAIILAGSTAGFLVFNFHPASIFMGDSGSLFLGFMLAGLTLFSAGSRQADLVAVLAIPTVLLIVPIFDTSLVTVVRKFSGRRISQGGRDHSSHRLVALGLSERKAVLLLWGLSFTAGVIAVLTNLRQLPMGRLPLPIFLVFLMILGIYLGRVKVYKESEINQDTLTARFTPLLSDLMHKRRAVEVVLDLVLIVFCYYASYILRFERSPFQADLQLFTRSLTIIVACHMIAFFAFGVYRGLWRYVGVSDLLIYAKAALAGNVLSIMVLVARYRFDGYSRSLFVINTLLVFMAVAASRLSFRLLDLMVRQDSSPGKKTIIYGAGDGGTMALKELVNNNDIPYAPLGFIDDDETKHNRKIHGYPVFGGLSCLETTIKKYDVKMIIVSSRRIESTQMQQVRMICDEFGLELSRLQIGLEPVESAPIFKTATNEAPS